MTTEDQLAHLEQRRRRAVAATRIAVAVAAVAVLVLVLVDIGTTIAVRRTQTELATGVAAIEDCAEPGGKCYRRIARQQAVTVRRIRGNSIRAAAAVQVCADVHRSADVDTLIDCARSVLSAGREPPPPRARPGVGSPHNTAPTERHR